MAMKSRGVNEQDVAQAALELKEAGYAVTIQNVRHHLGRGSNTTIGKCLEAMGIKESGRRAKPLVLPVELTAMCESFALKATQVVMRYDKERFDTAAHPLLERIALLNDQLERSKQCLERLEWERMRVASDLMETEIKNETLRKEIATAREALAVERALRSHVEASHDPHGSASCDELGAEVRLHS